MNMIFEIQINCSILLFSSLHCIQTWVFYLPYCAVDLHVCVRTFDCSIYKINIKYITRNTLTLASVKERPQTLLVPSEEICKRVCKRKQQTYLTPSMISNWQILIVRRENAFCKFHTFFVFCLPCFLFTMFWNKKK